MGLEEVNEEVLRNAAEQAESMRREAETEAARILKEAEDRLTEKEKQMQLETEKKKDELRRRELSGAELEGQGLLLKTKKELVEETFAKAKEKLGGMSASERKTVIGKIIKKAASELRIGIVYCNSDDIGIVKNLGSFYVQPMDIMGGVIAESSDGRTRIDLSIDNLLQEIKEKHLSEIGEILFR